MYRSKITLHSLGVIPEIALQLFLGLKTGSKVTVLARWGNWGGSKGLLVNVRFLLSRVIFSNYVSYFTSKIINNLTDSI